ncbi:hypothetical protein PS15m_005051 [Mucor circinelloides]
MCLIYIYPASLGECYRGKPYNSASLPITRDLKVDEYQDEDPETAASTVEDSSRLSTNQE